MMEPGRCVYRDNSRSREIRESKWGGGGVAMRSKLHIPTFEQQQIMNVLGLTFWFYPFFNIE